VYLVLLIAAIAVLGAVVVVAMGRGGELAAFDRDLPERRFRLRTPADVATMQLPLALFGYSEFATGQALRSIAVLLAERDAEIARLRDQVFRLNQQAGQSAADAGAVAGQQSSPA